MLSFLFCAGNKLASIRFTRGKKRLDAIAAAGILEAFLEKKNNSGQCLIHTRKSQGYLWVSVNRQEYLAALLLLPSFCWVPAIVSVLYPLLLKGARHLCR